MTVKNRGEYKKQQSGAPFRIEIAGESSLLIYFGDTVSEDTSIAVHAASQIVRADLKELLVDLIPSYGSLLVIYNAVKIDFAALSSRLCKLLTGFSVSKGSAGELITLPVYYSIESGLDLQQLAKSKNLDIDALINIHTDREYRVYAMGFAPGFAYLGEVDRRIAAPRLATPRSSVPKGAVAIANTQTAVYPSESPGGWNLIGLCPIEMFDINAEPATPIKVGDRVKFEAVSRRQFLDLGGEL